MDMGGCSRSLICHKPWSLCFLDFFFLHPSPCEIITDTKRLGNKRKSAPSPFWYVNKVAPLKSYQSPYSRAYSLERLRIEKLWLKLWQHGQSTPSLQGPGPVLLFQYCLPVNLDHFPSSSLHVWSIKNIALPNYSDLFCPVCFRPEKVIHYCG